MPAAIPIAGLAIGALGAKKQADAQNKAASAASQAAQFNPYDINGSFGNVNFGNGSVSASGGGQADALRQMLGDQAGNLFSGGGLGDFQSFISQLGNQGLPSIFGDAMGQSGNLPTGSYLNQQGTMGMLGGQAQGLLGNFMQQGNGQYGGLQSQLAGQGMNLLGQAGQAAQGGFGNTFNLLNQASQGVPTGGGFEDLINSRLGMLRDQAAPFEGRALDSLQNRLFSQGRMGSTGGSMDMEAFARGLGQADLSRQLSAQDLGMQAQNQQFQQQLQRSGMFGNLANTSLGAETQQGQGMAALLGQLGQGALGQAQGFGGLDLQRALGFSGQLPGLLGLTGDFANQGMAGATDYSNLTNQRAQQRLSNSLSLFGFGQDVQGNQLNQGLSALGGQQSIDQQLMQLIALGGNIGGQQAYAGGNQARSLLQGGASAGGSLLGGIGAGLLSNTDQLNSLFGRNIQSGTSISQQNQELPLPGQ